MATFNVQKTGFLKNSQQTTEKTMDFYTAVIRKSAGYWVALCLENGIVGQGSTQEDAISKLKEAIESFLAVGESESNIYSAPLSIEELREFLMI